MQSKFRYVACMLFSLAFFVSCKENDTKPVEESPFFVFFDQSAIMIDTTPVSATTWDYGFVFNPLVNGKITKLGVKLPVTGEFTVVLWDLSGSTPVALKEQKISSTTIHTPAFVEVSPVAVQKDAKFGITVLANSFYRIQKQNASPFSFPLVVDNIRIVSFNEQMNQTGIAALPTVANDTRVAPCVNVVFVAD